MSVSWIKVKTDDVAHQYPLAWTMDKRQQSANNMGEQKYGVVETESGTAAWFAYPRTILFLAGCLAAEIHVLDWRHSSQRRYSNADGRTSGVYSIIKGHLVVSERKIARRALM